MPITSKTSLKLEEIGTFEAPGDLIANGKIAGIGDIHGLADHLEVLINAAKSAGVDRIVFTGDYIDRGPDGLRVIDEIIALQKQDASPIIETLMGNHEHILFNVLFNPDVRAARSAEGIWIANGGGAVIQELMNEGHSDLSTGASLKRALGDQRLAFLQALKPRFIVDNLLFVHAGADHRRLTHKGQGEDATSYPLLTEIGKIDGDSHPLWIRDPFLDRTPPGEPTEKRDRWHGGYFVVHGHTQSSRRSVARDMTKFRMNLDGGSYRSNHVRMAIFSGRTIQVLEAAGHS